MAGIYLGTTLLTGAGGGGGGSAGITKQHAIYASTSTFNLTSLGIATGDTVHLFMVAGGQKGGGTGNLSSGGFGGNVYSQSIVLGTAGVITATIGAGGNNSFQWAANSLGGATTISGGGFGGTTITTGTGAGNYLPLTGATVGTITGGRPGVLSSYNAGYAATSGLQPGYSLGGASQNNLATGTTANTGDGGNASGNGGSGIIIIYY